MNESRIDFFFSETTQAFHFLEEQYKYQQQKGFVESEDQRDTRAIIRYVGPQIGIQISWYFAGSMINVSFIQLLQPGIFPTKWAFFGHYPHAAHAIDIYTLAEFLGHRDDPNFFFRDSKPRNRNKRWKLIDTKLHDILMGLARATQLYAADILEGDSSMFPKVMAYATAQMEGRYPNT